MKNKNHFLRITFTIALTFSLIIINSGCQTNQKNQSEKDNIQKTLTSISGDISTIPVTLKNRDDLVFFGGFEESFNDEKWKKNWGVPYIEYSVTPVITNDGFNSSKSLRVKYPAGGIGPKETGASFPIVFASISNINKAFYDELYLRYYLKFEEGFDFRLGGKLPGLMGGGDSWTRSGGQQPDGTNGWTLRFMWREHGNIVVYAYLPVSGNQKYGGKTWGQDFDCNYKAEPGKWICIEEYVNIGTPGKDDGKLTVWINGEEKLNFSDLKFWDVQNDYGKIGGIYFSSFHGGNTKEWGPKVDSYIQFDEIVAATKQVNP